MISSDASTAFAEVRAILDGLGTQNVDSSKVGTDLVDVPVDVPVTSSSGPHLMSSSSLSTTNHTSIIPEPSRIVNVSGSPSKTTISTCDHIPEVSLDNFCAKWVHWIPGSLFDTYAYQQHEHPSISWILIGINGEKVQLRSKKCRRMLETHEEKAKGTCAAYIALVSSEASNG